MLRECVCVCLCEASSQRECQERREVTPRAGVSLTHLFATIKD